MQRLEVSGAVRTTWVDGLLRRQTVKKPPLPPKWGSYFD